MPTPSPGVNGARPTPTVRRPPMNVTASAVSPGGDRKRPPRRDSRLYAPDVQIHRQCQAAVDLRRVHAPKQDTQRRTKKSRIW